MRHTTTMSDGLRCSRPKDSEKAKMKMIQVDFVIVYLVRLRRKQLLFHVSQFNGGLYVDICI